MPFWKFTIFTFLGCLPWILMLTLIGREAGANWEDWQSKLHYVDYAAVVLIVGTVAYFAIRWFKNRNTPTAAVGQAGGSEADAPGAPPLP